MEESVGPLSVVQQMEESGERKAVSHPVKFKDIFTLSAHLWGVHEQFLHELHGLHGLSLSILSQCLPVRDKNSNRKH